MANIKAVALYDFQGEGDGELIFFKGDEITGVIKEDGDDWWQGSCRGLVGFFPASFVEEREDEIVWEDEGLMYREVLPRQWSLQHVGKWLESIDMPELVDTFELNEVGGKGLFSLDAERLDDMGYEIDRAIPILNAIASINDWQSLDDLDAEVHVTEDFLGDYSEETEKVKDENSNGSDSSLSKIAEEPIPSPPEQSPSLNSSSKQQPRLSGALYPAPDPAKVRESYRQAEARRRSSLPSPAASMSPLIPHSSFSVSGSKARLRTGSSPLPSGGQSRKRWMPQRGKRFEIPDIVALEIEDPDHHGWLSKQGGTHKNWKRRWFMLKDDWLYYFKAPEHSKALGCVNLAGYDVLEAPELNKKFGFKVTHPSERTYYLIADSQIEKNSFIRKLTQAAKIAQTVDTDEIY
eukprot:Lithocolla_globosa_v1_NODE_1058_length_2905_cov_16.696491.p1 type:complete len:406 gc:universal NODE_1058_length_2905_cov_16.696491:163-1380(+)